MKLTLHLNGEEKTYHTPNFVSGLVYRKVLEMQSEGRFPSSDPAHIDEYVGYLCEGFGNQFNIEEFWQGIHAPKVNDVLFRFNAYVGGMDEEEQEKEDGEKKGKQ